MSNKTIGEITCPLCRSQKAKVSVSKAGLTVATCHRCHMQLFTRSDLSDAALRGQLRAMPAEAPAEAAPAAAPSHQPESQPAADKPAWLQW